MVKVWNKEGIRFGVYNALDRAQKFNGGACVGKDGPPKQARVE